MERKLTNHFSIGHVSIIYTTINQKSNPEILRWYDFFIIGVFVVVVVIVVLTNTEYLCPIKVYDIRIYAWRRSSP